MRCPVNKLIVTIDKKFQDEIILKSGIKLYQDTKFRPEHHVTTIGKVVSVPAKLNDMIENKGVSIDVEAGDEVCFSYQVVYDVDGNDNHLNLMVVDGEEYWLVDYGQVFFAKRGEDIIPIAGNVVIDMIPSEKDEFFAGSMLIKPGTSKESVLKGQGKLRYIGKPLSHEPTLDVKQGDTVFFKPEIAAEYDIYGQKQLIIHQRDLLAKSI